MSAARIASSSSARVPENPLHLGFLQRKCGCGSHSSTTTDVHEQEADRIADQVMTHPVAASVSAAPPRIQRYAAPGGSHDSLPAGVKATMTGSGAPLEAGLRSDMEQRIGHDFSQVRLHSDSQAAASARSVNALAYTVGQHIVFASGHFAASSAPGRRLLAHELVHVVQQSGGSAAGARSIAAAPAGIQRKCQFELGEPAPACVASSDSVGGWPFHFNWGCDTLLPGEEANLSKLRVGRKLRIHGFASRDGDEAFNDRLSCHRANVISELIATRRPELSIDGRFKHGGSPAKGEVDTAGPKFWRSVVVEEVRQSSDEWLDPALILQKGWSLWRKASNSRDNADVTAAAAHRAAIKAWLESTPKSSVPLGRDLDRTDIDTYKNKLSEGEFLWRSIDQLVVAQGLSLPASDTWAVWVGGAGTGSAGPVDPDTHAKHVPTATYHVDIFGEGHFPGAINVGAAERTSTTGKVGTRVPNSIFRRFGSDAAKNRLPFEDHSVQLVTSENGPLMLAGLLDEIARIIAPGGTIVFFGPDSMEKWHDEMAKKIKGSTITKFIKPGEDIESVITVPPAPVPGKTGP